MIGAVVGTVGPIVGLSVGDRVGLRVGLIVGSPVTGEDMQSSVELVQFHSYVNLFTVYLFACSLLAVVLIHSTYKCEKGIVLIPSDK